jgi:hypothetical protein
MTSETRSWPLPEERGPFATAAPARRATRKPARSVWLLAGLAFLCGGLVSAAAFSIGWRHQAQHDSATQSALTAATARTHRLEQKVAALTSSLGEARGSAKSARVAAAAAALAEQALARRGAKVGEEARVSGGDGDAVASGAGSLSTAAARAASELKTLDTYLTTTPVGQLDPGYIASQTAYLDRQLTRLRGDAGSLGISARSLKTTLRKLGRDASGLKSR